MNTSTLKALLEALENAKNEKEKKQLTGDIVRELQLISEEIPDVSAARKKLTKKKAHSLSGLVTTILFKLVEHELASDVLELVRHVLGL